MINYDGLVKLPVFLRWLSKTILCSDSTLSCIGNKQINKILKWAYVLPNYSNVEVQVVVTYNVNTFVYLMVA